MDSSENQILSWYQTTFLLKNFRNDLLFNLLAPAKIWLSQTCQKWEEERRKRNDYRLSLPSFFHFHRPPPPTFSRTRSLSRLPHYLRAWNMLPY